MSYNVSRFHVDDYDFCRFDGPRAGEKALDFTLYDLQGQAVTLSDFEGKWLVLEMGANSCGMYLRNIEDNNFLASDYPDVEFVVVYVREPHPGERIGAHKSMEEKTDRAKSLEELYGEKRKVLVDSINGDMHIKYGLKPNSVYVINPEGQVIYRCDWILPDELKKVLDNRDQINTNEHADTTVLKRRRPSTKETLVIIKRSGWKAIWDWLKMRPRLGSMSEVDEYYSKHGQLARGDMK